MCPGAPGKINIKNVKIDEPAFEIGFVLGLGYTSGDLDAIERLQQLRQSLCSDRRLSANSQRVILLFSRSLCSDNRLPEKLTRANNNKESHSQSWKKGNRGDFFVV